MSAYVEHRVAERSVRLTESSGVLTRGEIHLVDDQHRAHAPRLHEREQPVDELGRALRVPESDHDEDAVEVRYEHPALATTAAPPYEGRAPGLRAFDDPRLPGRLQVDFDTDAMKFKVRLDYGVNIGDWRGAYRNLGA